MTDELQEMESRKEALEAQIIRIVELHHCECEDDQNVFIEMANIIHLLVIRDTQAAHEAIAELERNVV